MARFINADGVYINVDTIKEYWQDQDHFLHIELTDGEILTVTPDWTTSVLADLDGRDYVLQVIPVKEAVYSVYKENALLSHYAATRVRYLAVCADGCVRPLINACGRFMCDQALNHYGDYYRDQLGAFESITIEGEEVSAS